MGDMPSKPFPWGCSHCGTRTVVENTEDYVVNIKRNGKFHVVTVKNAMVPRCSSCGGKVLTEKVCQQIEQQIADILED